MARRARLQGPPSDTRMPSTVNGGHAAAELCSGRARAGVGAGKRGAGQASFGRGPRKGAAARLENKNLFFFFFKAQHKILPF
jgi:hypothetical protein